MFIFSDSSHTALAAVALRGGREIVIKHLLTDNDLLGPYVEKVAKGTQTADLGTVRLRFKLTLPVVLSVFELKAGAAQKIQKRPTASR